MLEVSEAAEITLGMILDTLVSEAGAGREGATAEGANGLRVGLSGAGGIALRLDGPRVDDSILTLPGGGILLIDKTMREATQDCVLDCLDTDKGPRLMLLKKGSS